MRRTVAAIGVFFLCAGLASIGAAAGPPVLGWDVLGFRAAQPEAQAAGPSAIALDAQGRTWVLDRLNGRVVRVGERVEASIPVAPDAELLAIGADGTIATYSALRSRVALTTATGASLGEVAVPRALGAIGAIAIGASHRVSVTVALQERFELGSPRFPMPLEVTLQGKHEGTFAVSGGRGVAVKAQRSGALLLIATPTADKAMVVPRPLGVTATAARIVGVDGTVACVRTETLRHATTIEVARQLLCMDVDTGAIALDIELPAPGAYAPRTELAVGAGTVALMTPTATGLQITRWSLRSGGAR